MRMSMTCPNEVKFDRGHDAAAGPLRDLRVLDFSSLLPGPHCTGILADLGADVIKVEPPGGEAARLIDEGVFLAVNRNKRSVVADLKDPDGLARCLEMARHADVVVEGFRPGVATRLGVGYDEIKRMRPTVIYCSISGYGQNGPTRLRPGHDLTYQAVAGALSLCSSRDDGTRPPGIPIADMAGSVYAAIAILAALRERDRTGEGAHLDVSIVDATFALVAPRGGVSLCVTGSDLRADYPLNDLYETADGQLMAVSAIEQKFWLNLRDLLVAYEPGLRDSRFDTPAGRHRHHADELAGLLANAFSRRSAAEWVEHFGATDTSVERVATLAEAAEAPRVKSRGIVAVSGSERHVVFPVVNRGEPMGRFHHGAPMLARTEGATEPLHKQ